MSWNTILLACKVVSSRSWWVLLKISIPDIDINILVVYANNEGATWSTLWEELLTAIAPLTNLIYAVTSMKCYSQLRDQMGLSIIRSLIFKTF